MSDTGAEPGRPPRRGGKTRETVVKVALGVVLGVALAGIAGFFGGGRDEAEAIIEEFSQSDEGGQTEIEKWCDSLDGYKLSQLDLASSSVDTPERLEEITDASLDLAGDAPPRAGCAVRDLDSLAQNWDNAAADPAFEDADPAEEAERVRDFQRDRELTKAAE